MADRLAIIAGRGLVPGEVARARPGALFVTLANVGGVTVPEGMRHHETRFEQLGSLFGVLRDAGVEEVVIVGAMERPVLQAGLIDAPTRVLLPRFQAALAARDDGLMRIIIEIFEEQGFAVRGAHEVVPGLVAAPGLALGAQMDAQAGKDADEGARLLDALAPLDLGQSVVVELGQCLGIETLQGTDALLDFVAGTRAELRRGRGVLVKMPKQGQELRLDMPVIGPATIEGAARAGLAGVVIAGGRVLLLERARVAELAARHGLFVVAR